MLSVWTSWIIGGTIAIFVFWQFYASKMMRQRLNRALFKIGYLLYANTRCGKWLNERHIRKANAKYGESGHSEITSFTYGSLQIWAVPCAFDNYAYAVTDANTDDTVVIDAGDGATVLRFLDEHSMVPKAILTTHRHWDHCGGNQFLKKRFDSIAVYGSAVDKPDSVNHPVIHEQEIEIGSLKFTAYLTPGHTRGHMVYLLKGDTYGSSSDSIFTGDLLFLAGCGKLFEGTAEEMLSSLDFVSSLSDSTLIWPGHEYAVADLVFSFTVDPENEVVQEKLTWARQQRQERLPTCPSTLKEEKQYNMFLRTGDVSLLKRLNLLTSEESAESVEDSDEKPLVIVTDELRVHAFARLREKKDKM